MWSWSLEPAAHERVRPWILLLKEAPNPQLKSCTVVKLYIHSMCGGGLKNESHHCGQAAPIARRVSSELSSGTKERKHEPSLIGRRMLRGAFSFSSLIKQKWRGCQ